MMKVGSLFSGIGGIELGLERTGGFETEWFVENNKFCQEVLKKHWKGKPIYGDITKIKWGKLPKVDVLTGGFPCQDISVAGKKQGIKEGTRSGLWFHFAKAIGILRPKIVLIENVSAITHRGLDIVLSDLAKEGYDAEWFDLRASDFGAPHKRERIFIIAYPSSNGLSDRSKDKKEKSEREARSENGRVHLSFITNDWKERIQRFKQEEIREIGAFSWCKDVREIEELRNRRDIPQPLFRGARDGIPNWMDRIKACGNAVVPQCSEFIGRRIKEVNN